MALDPRFLVTAPDLPGHGASPPPMGPLTLPAVAAAVLAQLRALHLTPTLVVGHSAGAAVLARLLLDHALAPVGFVGLNPALGSHLAAPFTRLRGLARSLATSPALTSTLARLFGRPGAIRTIVRRAGSQLPADTVHRYAELVRRPGQVSAALSMMANWDLGPLERDLPRLDLPTLLVTGDRDPWFPPAEMERLARRLPRARVAVVPGAGHLMADERPGEVAALLLAFAREVGAA